MALLAGSRLAAHTLKLTEGSKRLLPEIFPAVDHIERFSLRTESARELLVNADAHLGAVTLPYALAVHEDFVLTVLEMIKQAGIPLLSLGKPIKAWNMHESLFRSLGMAMPIASLAHFHLLRHMRNALIHEGGVISQQLKDAINGMPGDAIVEWDRLTGRHPQDFILQGKVVCATGDIFASFAIVKRLGREINSALQKGLPRTVWAQIIVDHYLQSPASSGKTRNSDQWMRALWGYARSMYGPLGLLEGELEQAAANMGEWTRPVGVVPLPRNKRTKRKK